MKALALVAALSLVACTEGAKTGPASITWDRDVCKTCSMVISDRHFAAQVRGGPKNQVAKFDDVGCAMKWLDEQPWADDAETQVWVARRSDGVWIDGRTARYVGGQTSPMGFNVGAVDPGTEGNDFTTQRSVVRELSRKR